MRNKYEILKKVVEEHQYTKINVVLGTTKRKLILDVQTATKMLNIIHNAPEQNRKKICLLPWDRLISLTRSF